MPRCGGCTRAGKPVIGVAADLLRRLAPELIVTQDLCEVCAVAEGEVYRLAAVMHPAPTVLTLSGPDVAGIWADIRRRGRALGRTAEGTELVMGWRAAWVGSGLGQVARRPRVRLRRVAGAALPCRPLGSRAGGGGGRADVGRGPGSHSARRQWHELSGLRPDQMVVMLCGFGVERALAELSALADPEALEVLRAVPMWVIDGNAYTSRSGPRVVDGAELTRSGRFWGRSGRTRSVALRFNDGPRPRSGSDMPPRILEAETPETLAIASGLFEEYAASLEVDLGFQGFDEELAGLPGELRPSQPVVSCSGFEGSEPAGCVAFRRLEPDVAR